MDKGQTKRIKYVPRVEYWTENFQEMNCEFEDEMEELNVENTYNVHSILISILIQCDICQRSKWNENVTDQRKKIVYMITIST